MKKIYALVLAACGIVSVPSCNRQKDFKIIKDYLIEMPTYKTLDYDYVADYFRNEPINLGACSAILKDVGATNDPHLIFGRNMDYGYSDKCAYIIRTEEEGGFKTLGLAYATNINSPDFSEVKSKGISEKWRKIVPFFCTDVINEHGLYCEIDMRNSEYDADGKSKFYCSGTNPATGMDVHMVALSRFVVNHCKTVDEAVEYVKHNINVFNNEKDWNFSFLLGDALGNYGLLEFAHNNIYFDNTKYCQTNYFLNSPLGPVSPTKDGESENHFGIGRYEFLTSKIGDVKNATDMYNLMNEASYSNVYKGYSCPFNMRSEAYGLVHLDGDDQSFKTFMSDEKTIEVYQKIGELMGHLKTLSDAEKKKLSWYWQSTFTNIVDIPNRTFHTRFFENPDYIFDFTV